MPDKIKKIDLWYLIDKIIYRFSDFIIYIYFVYYKLRMVE